MQQHKQRATTTITGSNKPPKRVSSITAAKFKRRSLPLMRNSGVHSWTPTTRTDRTAAQPSPAQPSPARPSPLREKKYAVCC